jgi:elongation factor Ts
MSLDLLKSIRNRTNLSYGAINKAIKELNTDDEDKIINYLREQGVLKAAAREGRDTNQGGIYSYVHEAKLGVLVEINCETDFVSRSDAFKQFGNDICLHIAANGPKFVSEAEVSQEFIDNEVAIAREQLINQGKPENMLEKILEGKKSSIVKEFSLLSQPFLKNNDLTVAEYMSQISQETGEKIQIKRFTVFALNA